MLIPDAPPVSEMAESSTVVPEATYNLRVHKAEYVATPKSKDAKGPYLKVQFVITGPGDKREVGRMVFQNYSLSGPGSFKLRELLKMTGHDDDFRLEDSDQLLGLECAGAVIITSQAGYSDKNEIKKHLPLIS